MKNILLVILVMLINTNLFAQGSQNVTLLGNWDMEGLATDNGNHSFNDIWGYAADGREYALLGGADAVHFIDITDPTNPCYIDGIMGGDTTVWRDMKVFQDHAYSVSDATEEGLMIFDLSDLPNSVTKSNQIVGDFSRSHNIYIDEANARLYAVGTNGPADVFIYDLSADLDNPTLIGSPLLPGGGYIHDIFVQNNIAYCSHGNNGFFIWNLEDPQNPLLMGSVVTGGYNHSNWISEDGSFIVYAEEVPRGLPLGIISLENLATGDLEVTNTFKYPLLGPEFEDSTPHNPYIKGDYIYASYYEDGIQIIDISDPANPTLAGYFDTHPENTEYTGYEGCWGIFPFFESNKVIASDRRNGLFIFQFDPIPVADFTVELCGVSNEDIAGVNHLTITPNPAHTTLNIEIEREESMEMTYQIFNSTGQLITDGQFQDGQYINKVLDIASFTTGMYYISFQNKDQRMVRKFVKQ